MTFIKGIFPSSDDSCGLDSASAGDNQWGHNACGSVHSGGGESRDSMTESSLSFAVTNSAFSGSQGADSEQRTSSFSESSRQQHLRRQRTSTTALKPQPRKSNDLSGLTIDKLDYSKLGLYGRDKELAVLKRNFDRLVLSNEREGDNDKKENEGEEKEKQEKTDGSIKQSVGRLLTLISGYSGTGKSALTYSLKRPTKRQKGLFVRGKFDLNNGLGRNNEPYAGIATACAAICGAILKLQVQNPNAFNTLYQQLQDDIGSELSLLIRFIPALNEVFDLKRTDTGGPNDDEAKEASETQRMSSLDDYKHRFRFAFLRFFRIVSNHFFPLVLVLDDLQWADAGSLDLLEVLISDRWKDNCSKFYILGTYRNNEVNETHIFYRTMKDLEMKSTQKEPMFEMTQLEIGNLDLDAVQNIIQELLSTDHDPSRSSGLAQVCLKKTHGNVFFLLQFLSMLQEKELLRFNFGTLSWVWKEQEIEANTSASDNVVDLLKDKMSGLTDDVIQILKVAACLGSTFDVRTLRIVWEELSPLSTNNQENAIANGNTSLDEDTLVTSLVSLEQSGYIVQSSESFENKHRQSYCWGHDQIQLAAASLTPEAERAAFGHRVGEVLVSRLDNQELDSAFFVVVNLLNGYCDDSRRNDWSSRLRLARLNLEASRKAISLSAFEGAAEYAGKGIELLPTDSAWKDHYDLSLNLYTVGAKAEGYIGNVETMEKYCNVVIGLQDRPVQDKFEVYVTWIDSILNRGHILDACDLLFDILKKFKCRFPTSSPLVGIGIVSNVIQIKATMKSRDATKLSKMDDRIRVELMALLDKLATCLYQARDDRMPLVVFRSLSWTMKYGFCDFSPVAFATTGMMLTGILDDLQGGSRYGQQALNLLATTSGITAARTKFCVYSFLFPYTQPLTNLLKPLFEAYDMGMKIGDTESATWAIYHWLILKFTLGTSLEILEKDMRVYSEQMNDLKRGLAEGACTYARQAFLNLLGRNNVDNPTILIGDAMNEEDYTNGLEDRYLAPGIHSFQTLLYAYFGEYVQQADSVIRLGHDYLAKAFVASPNNVWYTLMTGVCCFAAARQTGKKKYVKIANIIRSKVKGWLDMGNPNVKHYESFLEAEWNAQRGKKHAAIKHFEVAILLAARGGYQHDAAFASERLGEFQLFVMDDKDEAVYRFRKSIDYWRNWGALAKVNHIQNKYSHLMPQPTEIRFATLAS